MKQIFVLITVILMGSYASAQPICDRDLAIGMNAFKNGNYSEAKKYFDHALRQNCNNAVFQDWIKKCDEKLNAPKPPVQPEKSEQQIRCEQRWKDGKEAYDKNDYGTALIFFQKGAEEKCTNVDFRSYIDICSRKVEQQKEAEQKNNVTLSVSPTEIEFEAAGGSKTIYVTTNYSSWSSSSVLSWLSINKFSSSIILTCSANTSTNDRTDYFDITAGSKTVRVHIRQKGQEKTLDLTEVNRLISWNMNASPTSSPNNGKYKGQTYNDYRNGLGAYYWNDNSEFYFGSWSMGYINGNSVRISLNGNTFTNCPNCTFYVGNWSNSNKSGTGTCYDKTGKLIYYGDFTDDKPTDTYPTVNSYLDKFRFEVLSYTDGGRYIGETMNGKRHGMGILLWGDGGMWYGSWKDGERAGSGIYISLDGSITAGAWTGNTYTNN